MNLKVKGIIFFAIFFCFVIISIIVTTCHSNSQDDKEQKERSAMVDSISFKGRVINSKTYQFGGKNYYVICVRLDYTNVKNCYILNDLCAIKIKNNIATMAAGFLTSANGVVDYVEVNMNHNKREKFTFKNGFIDEFGFGLSNLGLTQQDMDYCN